MAIVNSQYKDLIFQGGGVKGIAYVGALEELDNMGLLEGVERVAGTSAGAITACLLALGYTSGEIYDIVFKLNFSSFEDRKSYFRIFTKYGLYAGDAFLKFISQKIEGKGLSAKATFADLKARNGARELKVFSTDLYTQNIQEFSFDSTPNAIVAEAVRASMSIPLFFKGWKFSNKIPNDHIYVDGGVLLNFPINAFAGEDGFSKQTLGLHLDNLGGKPTIDAFNYCHPVKYVRSLFDTLLTAQVVDFENNPDEKRETICINDLGISATDFNITTAQKKALIQQGKDAVIAYFTQ